MPDDSVRIDPQADDRRRLRTAIAALREEKRKIEALEAAKERNSDEGLALPSVRELEAALERAKRDEPSRLAYAVINGEPDEVSPVPAAEAALKQARAKHERGSQIFHALDSALTVANRRLDQRERDVRSAVAEVVAGCSVQQTYGRASGHLGKASRHPEGVQRNYIGGWNARRILKTVANIVLAGSCHGRSPD